ncbi:MULTISPECIES: nucleoid occlusion protein [Brevibacillus]|jgi:ParB family chromosome partitioning protein|uniref:Chromosome partitioning protein, ParB family n=1 Tax=Brevibacillus centrosporus TaxID=54910 RepID=A0A1I3YBF4_9BACL|nr:MULTISPECIES: nucleoid occlusion protein [Brevibacillus]MEC2128983.1 nucleoid occlusion protein [Brevibacillus centrosporus]MED1795378.1 nucleoid occlusion protein [Brevibacillus nitrificans]MED1951928.1 nucleoid occlusion protein [Brevibacillus centrosporus]MED4907604.1 nucleoid occlusion protein [Brevibacillus centrosporus]RNB70166.1 nucleoid occlusion protein [Brevibacillus centrosporus]
MAVKDSFSRIFGLTDKTDNEEIRQIPVEEIVPNPYQPRTVFDDERIDELCQTIRTHGLIQPIVVRVRDGQYELIAGERRLRATKKLGMERIPAIVKEFNDAQTASIALIENLQREGLTAIEEAVAYQKLIDLHSLTQESLAQRLGKGQSTIANKLRLLHLPQEIQDALLARQVTERHARALIPLKQTELQVKVLQEILEREWNVKQTEVRVKQLLEAEENPKKEKEAKPKWKAFSRDARIAINTVRQSIDMVLQTGLSLETDEEDHDEFYQFTIRIPKNKDTNK